MSSMPYLTPGTMPKKEWPVIKEKKRGFLSNFKEAIEGYIYRMLSVHANILFGFKY